MNSYMLLKVILNPQSENQKNWFHTFWLLLAFIVSGCFLSEQVTIIIYNNLLLKCTLVMSCTLECHVSMFTTEKLIKKQLWTDHHGPENKINAAIMKVKLKTEVLHVDITRLTSEDLRKWVTSLIELSKLSVVCMAPECQFSSNSITVKYINKLSMKHVWFHIYITIWSVSYFWSTYSWPIAKYCCSSVNETWKAASQHAYVARLP